jgi:recombination protein RecA
MSRFKKLIEDLQEEHDLPPKPIREYVTSGVLSLDLATKVPGIPRGCLIDLFGEEALGKTTLALTIAAERIKRGEHCVYLDIEHRMNPDLASGIIGDTDKFAIMHPKHGDAAMDELHALAAEPEVRLIIVDSVAALIFKAALENPDKSYNAAIALEMSNALKRLAITVYQSDCIVIFINQMRSKVMTYGPVTAAPTGGKALKFHTSLRMHMTQNAPIRVGESIIGQRVDITMVKNSYRKPFGKCTLPIIYGEGVDKMRDLLDMALATEVVDKSSSWYSYKDIKENGEAAFAKAIVPHYAEIFEETTKRFTEKELNTKFVSKFTAEASNVNDKGT